MNAAFVAARAVHFGATMLLVGELAFASLLAVRTNGSGATRVLDRHVRIYTTCALVASGLSGLAWLVVEASNMSGIAIGPAILAPLRIVALDTEFGHVALLRLALFAITTVSLVWICRAKTEQAVRWRSVTTLVVAALYLAALAGAGHAAAASGGDVRIAQAVHVVFDALHLLAAGAWLGALPPLVFCLMESHAHEPWRLARRFSVLGIVCVITLIASGIANSLLLVGSFAALFGTDYGRLLVVKLALFALMIAIAATNRLRLTPALASDQPRATHALARNATIEIVCGIAIVAIVGALGTMVPGAHQSPVWPFDFTLDFTASELTTASIAMLAAAGAVALVAFALIISGVRRNAPRTWLVGCAVLLASAAASTSLFALQAYPTTYASPAQPYTVDVVARGADRYARDCAGCHGAQGHGDGPAAASLATKPVNLAEHALHHPPGNLFWWIAHGIPNSPMPSFSPQLSDNEIWEIVQFLIARASAEAAASIGPRVARESMSRAPEFTYELPAEGRPAAPSPKRPFGGQRNSEAASVRGSYKQQTLLDESTPALIVLYTMPASAARLTELASYAHTVHGKLRVIAIASNGSTKANTDHAIVSAVVDDNVADVYRMFVGDKASHAELLIDKAGIVRARFAGVPANGAARDAQISAALKTLPQTSSMTMPMHHRH